MKEISTAGLDLAKNVFQVHAVDAAGRLSSGGKSGERRCCCYSRA
jgi:hypothetical protein